MNSFAQMVMLVQRRLRRRVVGLYADQATIVVTDVLNNRRQSFERHTIVESHLDNVSQLCSIFAWLRRQYRSRRSLIILFCTPCTPNDSVEQRRQIYEYVQRLRSEVLFFEFEICALLGADIDVAALEKQLVAFITESTVRLYLLFAGGFEYKTDPAVYAADHLAQTLEAEIATLKDEAPRSLPERFSRYPFPEQEVEAVKSGWNKGYAEELYVIFLCTPPALPSTMGGHWVVGLEAGAQRAMQGLERFLEEIECTKSGRTFLRLLRYRSRE